MEKLSDPKRRTVVSLVKRRRRQEEEFIALVDALTKQLHYALIPVQTSIQLSRRRCKLPPLD